MSAPINDGGAEFPVMYVSEGMTLRDYFAGQALISMCASSNKEMDKLKPDGKYFEKHVRDWYEITGLRAYCYADAILDARAVKRRAP